MGLSSLWKLIFNRRTDAERKRDKYYYLYQALDKRLTKFDEIKEKIEDIYSTCKGRMPNFSDAIPAVEYKEAELSVSDCLQKHISTYEEKREEIVLAKNAAFSRYKHYQQLAITEKINLEREEARIEEEKRKEREEKFKNLTRGW